MPITIRFGKRKFEREYSTEDLAQISLKKFKEYISTVTELSPKYIKVIYSGAILKNENTSLATYRINNNSNLLIMGSYFSKETSEALTEEQRLQNQIQNSLKTVDEEISPLIDQFPKDISKFLKSHSNYSTEERKKSWDKLELEHRRIGELLLRELLALDNAICGPEMVDIRNERKTAVKTVQSLLSQVDKEWEKIVKLKS